MVFSACRRIFDAQRKRGKGAYIEQPDVAESWQQPEMMGMTGYDARLDQCRFGLIVRDAGGRYRGKIRKRTRIRATKKKFAEKMSRKCQCTEEHVHAEGGLTKKLQNYPMEMVKAMAELLSKLSDEEATQASWDAVRWAWKDKPWSDTVECSLE